MNEIEQLREQAKKRRKPIPGEDSYRGASGLAGVAMMWSDAEAALDRALEIAEKLSQAFYDGPRVPSIVAERDEARRIADQLAEAMRSDESWGDAFDAYDKRSWK